jgi:acetate kinase
MSQSAKLVLALNAGSSSLKASVIQEEETIVAFLAERLTTSNATIHMAPKGRPKVDFEKEPGKVFDHAEALTKIIEYLETTGMLANLVAVGHRVVHGGSIFSDSALVNDESLAQMASVSHLAPL